eukprot:1195973-Prorocentrum_minimum.AAC.2
MAPLHIVRWINFHTLCRTLTHGNLSKVDRFSNSPALLSAQRESSFRFMRSDYESVKFLVCRQNLLVAEACTSGPVISLRDRDTRPGGMSSSHPFFNTSMGSNGRFSLS